MNRYLHRILVFKTFWGTIWHNIVYHLTVITLTEDQGEWLTKELYRKLLQEVGVNHDLLWAYRHAFKMFQWMGLREINIEQTIDVVGYCMIHCTSYTLMGEAMRSLEEHVQMEIIMGTPFVQLPFDKLGMWITETWLKIMWKNKGSLELELLWSDLH